MVLAAYLKRPGLGQGLYNWVLGRNAAFLRMAILCFSQVTVREMGTRLDLGNAKGLYYLLHKRTDTYDI